MMHGISTIRIRFWRPFILAPKKWPSVFLSIIAFTAGNACASTWPKIDVPKEIKMFDITGGATSVNGLPMRIQGFVSSESRERVATQFKESIGSPLVESRQGNKLLLGRLQGEFYVMVQMEQAGNGTRGTMSVSHLKAAYDSQDEIRAISERWLNRMPAGTKLVSQMISEDAGKHSTHLVFHNAADEVVNGERVKVLLQEEGMTLQHEGEAEPKSVVKGMSRVVVGKTMFFKGGGKDAVAVIFRDVSGRTAVVLNTVKQMENPR